MPDLALLAARAEFYERAWATPEYLRYISDNGIDLDHASALAGATGLMPIVDCGNGRFDWSGAGQRVTGFICEALDEDGETELDLVAWAIDRPEKVLTLLGRAAMLGMWAAWNPATYYLGKPLRMHRTPLAWLRAGCRGAAVVHEGRAARTIIDLPGPMAAEDSEHARDLHRLILGLVSTTRIVVPRAA